MIKLSNSKCLSSTLSLFTILINLLLISCAETKVSQCQKIILLTQKMAEESESYRQTTDIKKVLQVADLFEETSQQMKQLKIEDEQLQEYQMGFADIYQGNADTTRQFVAALKDKDIDTAKLMQQQVQQLGKKEQDLGTEMNAYCQPD
ncbi:unknown [Crocosphaera subtropica ATCC 51142]|uniref:Uncharacterized protein n=2 Tax=Crocosphaera TaxID=263510 RepID=B1WVY3_CROS5|nr:unknown [Crocosphaera subtropica ATCC 51142]